MTQLKIWIQNDLKFKTPNFQIRDLKKLCRHPKSLLLNENKVILHGIKHPHLHLRCLHSRMLHPQVGSSPGSSKAQNSLFLQQEASLPSSPLQYLKFRKALAVYISHAEGWTSYPPSLSMFTEFPEQYFQGWRYTLMGKIQTWDVWGPGFNPQDRTNIFYSFL